MGGGGRRDGWGRDAAASSSTVVPVTFVSAAAWGSSVVQGTRLSLEIARSSDTPALPHWDTPRPPRTIQPLENRHARPLWGRDSVAAQGPDWLDTSPGVTGKVEPWAGDC